MSYPGDYDGVTANVGGDVGIDPSAALTNGQFTLVSQTNEGVPLGSGWARISVASGQGNPTETGERALLAFNNGRNEHEGDRTVHGLDLFFPNAWNPGTEYATLEMHSDTDQAGAIGIAFYGGAVWLSIRAGVNGSYNPATQVILSPTPKGKKIRVVFDILNSLTSGILDIYIYEPGKTPVLVYHGQHPTLLQSTRSDGTLWPVGNYPTWGQYRAKSAQTDVMYVGPDYVRRSTVAGADAALTTADGGGGGGTDTTPPVLETATVNGSSVVLGYSEPLDVRNVPAVGSYTVVRGGVADAVTSVSIAGNEITLTLTTPFASTDPGTVAYAQPVSGKATDLAQLPAASFGATALSNITAGITVGNTVVGAARLGSEPDYKRTNRIAVPQLLDLLAVAAYQGGNTGSHVDQATQRFLVHGYSVPGVPGSLLGMTVEHTIFGDDPEGWYTVAFASPLRIDPNVTPFITLAEFGTAPFSNVYRLAYDGGAADAMLLRHDSYVDGASDPWSASEGGGYSGSYPYVLSIYAVAALPTATVAPTVNVPGSLGGQNTVGQTNAFTPSTWLGTPTVTYQWLRVAHGGDPAAAAAIAGATGTSYTLADADDDMDVYMREIATNAKGNARQITGPLWVTEPPPSVVSAPTWAGTVRGVLVVDPGTWVGMGGAGAEFTYQWLRCDAAGANCAAISGATAKTYHPSGADVGHELRARVFPHNSWTRRHQG